MEHLRRSFSQESQEPFEKSFKQVCVLQSEALNKLADLLTRSLELRESASLKVSSSPPKSSYGMASGGSSNLDALRQKILAKLNQDSHHPRKDIRAILQSGLNSSLSDQDTSVYMTQSSHLQSFLRTADSGILLAQGGSHSSGGQRSPLGFVSAKLAKTLRDATSTDHAFMIIELHFFCGEHVTLDDNIERNCPLGVMKSLLTQLLSQFEDFDIGLINEGRYIELNDINTLGRVFGKLVAQLPDSVMLFCIIDGLSFYDDRERGEDCGKMVKRLVKLTRRRRRIGGCIFKLLITSSTELKMAAVEDFDEQGDIMRIPERLESEGGFSQMKWDVGVGHEIAVLSEG